MGSPSLFTRQRALKMGYFTVSALKNSNHLHTELSLGYPKDTKFYRHKQYGFIYAIFGCLVAGILHFFGQFRGQLEVLAWAKIHKVGDYFSKKICSTIKLFFFFKYVFY